MSSNERAFKILWLIHLIHSSLDIYNIKNAQKCPRWVQLLHCLNCWFKRHRPKLTSNQSCFFPMNVAPRNWGSHPLTGQVVHRKSAQLFMNNHRANWTNFTFAFPTSYSSSNAQKLTRSFRIWSLWDLKTSLITALISNTVAMKDSFVASFLKLLWFWPRWMVFYNWWGLKMQLS